MNSFKNDEQRKKWNAYNTRYSKRHYKNITIKLNYESEAETIAFLERHGNKIIKELLKEALAKEGK